MAEGGIDDAGMRHGKHQLLETNTRQQLLGRKQSIVGGCIELEEGGQVRFVIADVNEHAVAFRQVP